MKVVINGKTHDPENDLIVLVLTEQDKINLSNMHKDATLYACYNPEKIPPSALEIILDEIKEDNL